MGLVVSASKCGPVGIPTRYISIYTGTLFYIS